MKRFGKRPLTAHRSSRRSSGKTSFPESRWTKARRRWQVFLAIKSRKVLMGCANDWVSMQSSARTKWRAVITIGANMPSRTCIEANAHALARFAALSQEAGLVPIVEPEVLMDGDHTIDRHGAVTEEILHRVFRELRRQHVALEGMLLKTNMVLA